MNIEMDAARKAAEKARKEAEHANAAKQDFLSSMSHDIRTPMNAIIGMTSIAMANTGSQEQVEECLRKIALSSRHLLGLINDVLDVSKIESGKMTLNIVPEIMGRKEDVRKKRSQRSRRLRRKNSGLTRLSMKFWRKRCAATVCG